MIISTKRQMYDLYNRGLLGNNLRNWDTLDECITEAGDTLIGVRCRKIGGPCVAMKTPDELRVACAQLWTQGWRESDFMFGESPPHHNQTIQGEVQQSENFYDLTYSTAPGYMRDALAKETICVSGLRAKMILEHYMDPNTWLDIQELFELYPGHVIEFTCFSHDIGTKPHRNTVLWECRAY